MLLKAIVEGLGGGKKAREPSEILEIPPDATEAMRNSAMAAIAAKAGSRLPIVRGRDKGLPKASPVFDIEEMRRRNAEVSIRRKGKR